MTFNVTDRSGVRAKLNRHKHPSHMYAEGLLCEQIYGGFPVGKSFGTIIRQTNLL